VLKEIVYYICLRITGIEKHEQGLARKDILPVGSCVADFLRLVTQ